MAGCRGGTATKHVSVRRAGARLARRRRGPERTHLGRAGARTAGGNAASVVPARQPASALRDCGGRPLLVLWPRDVAAVGGLEGNPAEAERAPRSEPGVDRRADMDPDADQVVLDQDGLENPLALEQRDVEER